MERRTILRSAGLLPVAALAGCARTPSGTGSIASPPAVSGGELPRGGREIFPRYRLFGYVGYPGAAALGRLGTGDLDARVTEIEQKGAAFAAGREILPILELIAVTAHRTPGPDNMFRTRVGEDVIATWLQTARRHKALLLLDIQPGRAEFLDEVRFFEKWLKEPDVGVALDPEWAVDADQVPGAVFGNTSGPEINDCAAYLAGLVREHRLPQKVLVYHQLHPQIVTEEPMLAERPEVVFVKSVDGIGSPALKRSSWNQLKQSVPPGVHLGFKLFFDEDVRKGGALMTPAQVLELSPQPEYVLYE